ncbi:MAG: hypothetical protein D6735_01170 [Acidobacteria bacterium]|jgi:hypothetical protein|nr:MAG: hypothetical protein D6735_01170 [Acidobacteriota bacterium]
MNGVWSVIADLFLAFWPALRNRTQGASVSKRLQALEERVNFLETQIAHQRAWLQAQTVANVTRKRGRQVSCRRAAPKESEKVSSLSNN